MRRTTPLFLTKVNATILNKLNKEVVMNEVTIYGLSGRCRDKKRNFIIPLHEVEFDLSGIAPRINPIKVRAMFTCPICKLYHRAYIYEE